MGDVLHGGNHLGHLLAGDLHLLGGQAGILLGLGGGADVGLGGVAQFLQSGLQLLYRAGLLRSSLGQRLRPAGELLGIAGHLLLRPPDLGKRLRNIGGKAVDGGLNGLKITDKGGAGLYVKVAVGELRHNAVDVLHIAVDAPHGLLQVIGQTAQLILGCIMQIQVKPALVEGLAVLGDNQDGLDNAGDYVNHQADKGDQRQRKADNRRAVHNGDDVLHLRLAGGIGLIQHRYHLVQLAHQDRQVALNGVLIIISGLGRAGLQQIQHVDCGLMQLLVQRLHFLTQLQDIRIVRTRIAINPLPQHTGIRRCAARKFHVGIQRVAEIAGPLVMRDLRLVAAAEQGGSLLIGGLGPVHTDDVHGNHHAEQKHGRQRTGHPNPYASFDTLTHGFPLFFLHSPRLRRPSQGGRLLVSPSSAGQKIMDSGTIHYAVYHILNPVHFQP